MSNELFTLPPLAWPHDALEPYIDKTTMEIHHGKHHGAYVANLNKAIENTGLAGKAMEDILKDTSKLPPAVRNNGGGHFNHSLFWTLMSPTGNRVPSGKLSDAIHAAFGSLDSFKEKFAAAGMGRFGSGWCWLTIKDGKMEISSTPNQDNPLMDVAEMQGFPLLGLDVWEHAYYLRYQNRRADYIKAWWNVVNWDAVAERFNNRK